MTEQIVGITTRFAPSPTGHLHFGGARTALFAWLAARSAHGRFLLRIEDTDSARSTEAYSTSIIEGLDWLGLNRDAPTVWQSDNRDRHLALARELLEAGRAYCCDCSPERLQTVRESQQRAGDKPRYDGHCRQRGLLPKAANASVVRLRNPDEGVSAFCDAIHGEVSVDNAELDDMVLVRSDGMPTYHLSAVVDDADMGVTLVVRGDDHLGNTARQLNLIAALGWPPPIYAHVPMLLGEDGTRLSKRQGARDLLWYREQGYVPEAVLSSLARLGWSHGDQEIFSPAELIDYFSLERVKKSPAVFDSDRLEWVQRQSLQGVDAVRFIEVVTQLFAFAQDTAVKACALDNPYLDINGRGDLRALLETSQDRLGTLLELVRGRATTVHQLLALCLPLLLQSEDFIAWARLPSVDPAEREMLNEVVASLGGMPVWEFDEVQNLLVRIAHQRHIGFARISKPVRLALTGREQGPSVAGLLWWLGREQSLARLGARARI